QNPLHSLDDELAALHLHTVGAGLLHDPDRALEREPTVALVRAEGHIDHHECPLYAADDRSRMGNHLVEGYRNGRLEAMDDIRRAVSDQHHVDPGAVENAGKRVVVGG